MTDRDQIEKLLDMHKRSLHMLEQQQAEFGQFCPPYVTIGIQDTRAKIAELEAQLGRRAPAEAQSNLPRLPYFFGREDELAQIAEALTPDARGWGMLIDGPGGIGKTALAIHAAHQAPVELFPRKIFLTAKRRELTAGGEQPLADFTTPDYMALLTELGRELGDDAIGKSDPAERPRLVRDRLARERALLVLDNLETLPEPERVRLFQFLDRLPLACKALVTSRRRGDINARSLRLDRLSPPAGLQLIGALARDNTLLARANPAERDQLYAAAQGNPLLIRWVAGQLGRPGSQCRSVADACRFMQSAPAGNDPLEYIFGDLISVLTPSETAVLAALAHFKEPARVEWAAEIAGLAQAAAQNALDDLHNRALLDADAEGSAFVLPALAAAFVRRRLPEQVAASGERLAEYAFKLAKENGYEQHARYPVLEAVWPLISAALPLLLEGETRGCRWCVVRWSIFLISLGAGMPGSSSAKPPRGGHWPPKTSTMPAGERSKPDGPISCAIRPRKYWRPPSAPTGTGSAPTLVRASKQSLSNCAAKATSCSGIISPPSPPISSHLIFCAHSVRIVRRWRVF
jgi:hypothetical protein